MPPLRPASPPRPLAAIFSTPFGLLDSALLAVFTALIFRFACTVYNGKWQPKRPLKEPTYRMAFRDMFISHLIHYQVLLWVSLGFENVPDGFGKLVLLMGISAAIYCLIVTFVATIQLDTRLKTGAVVAMIHLGLVSAVAIPVILSAYFFVRSRSIDSSSAPSSISTHAHFNAADCTRAN